MESDDIQFTMAKHYDEGFEAFHYDTQTLYLEQDFSVIQPEEDDASIFGGSPRRDELDTITTGPNIPEGPAQVESLR
ncbi:hypothetical protein U1Q18_007959 [Sarracenia purpurea var. burkii]